MVGEVFFGDLGFHGLDGDEVVGVLSLRHGAHGFVGVEGFDWGGFSEEGRDGLF